MNAKLDSSSSDLARPIARRLLVIAAGYSIGGLGALGGCSSESDAPTPTIAAAGTTAGSGGSAATSGGSGPAGGGAPVGISGSPGAPSGSGQGGISAGGNVGAQTAGAAGGSATSSTSSTCAPNPLPETCSGVKAPLDGVVIDFATYQPGGAWGVSMQGDLTGGTSLYGTPPINRTPAAGALQLQVTIPPTGYAGVVFWFGPCVNASAFSGLSATLGGSLGGALLKLQVQTHLDYPVDVSAHKGGCVFTDCATRWSECVGPTATVAVPPTPSLVDLPWTMFVGGKPMATVTPEGVVGLQFQLECPAAVTAGCVVDFTLGTITLRAPAPAPAPAP